MEEKLKKEDYLIDFKDSEFLLELIKDANIKPDNLDKEVEENSGKAAYIAERLHEAETRYEMADIKLDALDGKSYEVSRVELDTEGKKATDKAILARQSQNKELMIGKLKVAQLKSRKNFLKRLLEIYDKRFNMLASRGATIRMEMDTLKTSI